MTMRLNAADRASGRVCRRSDPILSLAVLGLIVGCGGDPASQGNLPQGPIDTHLPGMIRYTTRTIGDTTYQAGVRIVPHSAHQGVYVHVLASRAGRNERVGLATLDTPWVELRVHALEGATREPVWSSLPAGEGECRAEDPSSRDQAPLPGQVISFGCRYAAPRILGDSLPAGEYRLQPVLRLDERLVLFRGDTFFLSADTLPPIGGRSAVESHLDLRVRAAVVDSTHFGRPSDAHWLQVLATAVNVGSRRIELTRGECNLDMDIRSASVGSNEVLWSHRRRAACLDIEIVQVIAPGETAEVGRVLVPLRMVLGDSLPDGTYRLDLKLNLTSPGPRTGIAERLTVPFEVGRIQLELDT